MTLCWETYRVDQAGENGDLVASSYHATSETTQKSPFKAHHLLAFHTSTRLCHPRHQGQSIPITPQRNPVPLQLTNPLLSASGSHKSFCFYSVTGSGYFIHTDHALCDWLVSVFSRFTCVSADVCASFLPVTE